MYKPLYKPGALFVKSAHNQAGSVAEWFKAAVLKTAVPPAFPRAPLYKRNRNGRYLNGSARAFVKKLPEIFHDFSPSPRSKDDGKPYANRRWSKR